MVDRNYCMSSYLTFRYVEDKEKKFAENLDIIEYIPVNEGDKIICNSSEEIERALKDLLQKKLNEDKKNIIKPALLLSGGIDSAILASYVPKQTKCYTAKCVAPNAIDETIRAKQYCESYGLEHVVVDITWDDYLDSIDYLMLNDGCPVNSNEPQIYKLVKEAQKDGANLILFGDNADMAFGGLNELMSKDWTYDEWIKRYTYLDPIRVIKEPKSMQYVFDKYRIGNNDIDYIKFIDIEFSRTSSGAYYNAFRNAKIDAFDPYAYMKMSEKFDLQRIRNGENKYYLRELFKKRYPDFEVPEKIAMPRAVDYWMKDWKGPIRDEFLENCIDGLTGKQKFQVFALERFLNLIEGR